MPRIRDDSNPNLTVYVREIWKAQGRDMNTCELCGATNIKGTIHHTKYENCTLKDLVVACMSCQTKGENRNLI